MYRVVQHLEGFFSRIDENHWLLPSPICSESSHCYLRTSIQATIDDFRGACAVKGNVQVAGRTSSVSTTEMLSTHDVTLKTLTVHYFMFKFDLSWGIRTKMGKTEGIFLNLQCDCHIVASMFIKRINLYTNFSTLLPNVTALWINGVSLNSLAHTFLYRTHRPNK